MRESYSLERRWRLVLAALSASSAVLITTVLSARLPQAPVSIPVWWTLATWIAVGGLSAITVAATRAESPAGLTSFGRLAVGIAAAGVTAVAVLATTHHAGVAQFAAACLLSAMSFAAAIGFVAMDAFAESPASVAPGPNTATEEAHAAATSVPVILNDEPAAQGSDSEVTIALPDHIQQTSSRYIAESRDHLETCLRVRFEPGQQTAIVHVPIQPAMQCDPDVECEPVGDDDLRITVDPAQPYGIRLVCRRPAPWSEACEAVVAVLISADRMAAAA